MELRADLRLLQRPQLIPKMVQAVEMMALPLLSWSKNCKN